MDIFIVRADGIFASRQALITAVLLIATVVGIGWLVKRQSHGNRLQDETGPDYSHIFPPSQRHLLPALVKQFPAGVTLADGFTPKKVLRLDENYQRAGPSRYVYSGFSVGEIKGLGRFPDYATLSGVPLPSPARDFDTRTALSRPYRPFRWAYHQTMSLSKMDNDYWLELESTYTDRIRQRKDLFATEGSKVLQALPGSELACKELVEMAIQFLCARYPGHFELQGDILRNRILDTTSNLSETPPLDVLLNHVPEDFGIMLRDAETGRYVLRAGIICSALGWTLGGKMGMGLAGIHGPVPDYKEKMQFSMDRFFTKMRTNSPIQRGSWGLEMGQPLYLPAHHPDFGHRDKQNPSLKVEDVFLRVDWQTLRRLPLSGAVVFNFKALFTPLSHFRNEPYIPSLVLKVLDEAKENILKYKGSWHVEHVAKPALREYERYQVESGMMEKDWAHRTLDEYPFFPGWNATCKKG